MALSICVDQDQRINYRKKDRKRKGYTMIDMSTKLQGGGEAQMAKKSREPKRYCEAPTPSFAGAKGPKEG